MNTIRFLIIILLSQSTLLAQLPREAILPKERFEVDWAGEVWIKVSDKADRSMRIIEYVRKGDRLKSWKELITEQAIITKTPNARVAVDAYLQGLRRRADGFESVVISQRPESVPTEVFYEWWHTDSRGYGPEHVIGLAVWRQFSVSYSRTPERDRSSAMTNESYG